MKLVIYSSPESLPAVWDEKAECFFQTRSWLSHLHEANPCNQQYFLLTTPEGFFAMAVIYRLRLNLFTYSFFSLKVPLAICGIPVSCSAPGIFGDEAGLLPLMEAIAEKAEGLLLFLNTAAPLGFPKWPKGNTLPSVVLEEVPRSWEGYFSSLRHAYRRRLQHILDVGRDLLWERTPFSRFDASFHALYENVFQASDEKLEHLALPFFQKMSEPFALTAVHLHGDLVAWYITLREDGRHSFFLCGLDYRFIATHQVYLNILYRILGEAMEAGAKLLDYGQTSEEAKLKVGCGLSPRWMSAYHSSPLALGLLGLCGGLLSYGKRFAAFRVMKERP